MAIYINIDGIKGNVTTSGYEEWVEVDSLQWGTGRAIMTETGRVSDREGSTPTFSEISLTKDMDKSSPYIFTESVAGASKPVEIHILRTEAGGTAPYVQYDLENCLISSYSVSSSGDKPTESFSLNFTKLIMRYIPGKEDHSADAPIPAGYDIESATKV
jgi:type VI secretion system secreted protein Hcp